MDASAVAVDTWVEALESIFPIGYRRKLACEMKIDLNTFKYIDYLDVYI
jgi:hypothetical protein